MAQNGLAQIGFGGLAEHGNRLSAFKPVISRKPRKQACPRFLPEYNIQDNPLAALEDFVTNYFSEESSLELDRVPLKKQRSFNRKPLPETISKSTKKSVFSEVQVQTLEDSFQFKQHLSPNSREWLAKLIGLSKRQVITWFQNRRARERKRAGIKMPRHGKKCVVMDFTISDLRV